MSKTFGVATSIYMTILRGSFQDNCFQIKAVRMSSLPLDFGFNTVTLIVVSSTMATWDWKNELKRRESNIQSAIKKFLLRIKEEQKMHTHKETGHVKIERTQSLSKSPYHRLPLSSFRCWIFRKTTFSQYAMHTQITF